ncbi:MAG: putative signal peptide peptidase sppA [Chlamydiota bacterium]|jgi:signal peptide peptidase SppA
MEIARESIFVSGLRAFCRFFFAVWGVMIALFLCMFVYSAMAPSSLIPEKTLMHILPDADGKRDIVALTAPAILQIPIHGVIGGPQKLDGELIENILLDSRDHLLSRDRVKGILLHINTPGGTVVDTDDIYRLLLAYKARYEVPVYGYVDGLCASGGMYIASAADRLYASSSSIIGSVGVVIGPFFNVSDLLQKVGIQARTLTQGIDKDMMNPTRPWKPGEDASLIACTSFMYQQFVDIVAQGRPRVDRQKLVNEYGAQIFDCKKAEEIGYIDQAMATRNDALKGLLEAAGVDPTKPYQVVELEMRKDVFSDLIAGKSPLVSGKIEHSLDIGLPLINAPCAYLYAP